VAGVLVEVADAPEFVRVVLTPLATLESYNMIKSNSDHIRW
jgi:hypothetical protein